MTMNDKQNLSLLMEAHGFTLDPILSYEPAEPKELHKPTDLFPPILLLTPKETTTFALVVNSY